MKDSVPPNGSGQQQEDEWNKLGESNANFHVTMKMGYQPAPPTNSRFVVDGKFDKAAYAKYLRSYRLTASKGGITLPPLSSVKALLPATVGVKAA